MTQAETSQADMPIQIPELLAQPAIVVLAEEGNEDDVYIFKEIVKNLANFLNEPVGVTFLSRDTIDSMRNRLAETNDAHIVEPDPPPAPMTAAPFMYRDDGKPDWGAMWTTFCELALYGGPPHRGDDNPVRAPVDASPEPTDVIWEMRRGIGETTGLYAKYAATGGWLEIRCDSKKMAAWLCAAIIVENIDARCDGNMLFVPASPDFELENQAKSVITVLAKSHHYWIQHILQQGVDPYQLWGHTHDDFNF